MQTGAVYSCFMPPGYDDTDFVDRDFQNAQRGGSGQRPPTREELESKVGETQERLAQLKRAQEVLERERTALEEARRRRVELETGRQEMIQHLTRGIGLLEEAVIVARRDAEQMGRAMADFQEALGKVQSIQEQTWTEENYNVELTKALTAIENSRMEWNSARVKLPVLSGEKPGIQTGPQGSGDRSTVSGFAEGKGFFQLCKLGLALTWPLAVVALLATIILTIILIRHR